MNYRVPTSGPLNYIRYGSTKNVSKMSMNEKIKRLLNMYRTYKYSNERKQLSNVNQRIFGKKNFTANGILEYIQAMNPSFKNIPQKLPPKPPNVQVNKRKQSVNLYLQKYRTTLNNINRAFLNRYGSLNDPYRRNKLNVISERNHLPFFTLGRHRQDPRNIADIIYQTRLYFGNNKGRYIRSHLMNKNIMLL